MDIVASIFEVFTGISTWIVTTVTSMVPIFYASETGITFLGVLALCGVGVGVILLVFNLVRNLLRFS